jgi:hypothetical protein
MKKRIRNNLIFVFILILLLSVFLVNAQGIENSKNIFQKAGENIKSSYLKITGNSVAMTGEVTGNSGCTQNEICRIGDCDGINSCVGGIYTGCIKNNPSCGSVSGGSGYCGDKICNNGESCKTCADCGNCPTNNPSCNCDSGLCGKSDGCGGKCFGKCTESGKACDPNTLACVNRKVCDDSDNTLTGDGWWNTQSYFSKKTVTGTDSSGKAAELTDQCLGSSSLIEGYCDSLGNVANKVVKCPYNYPLCNDGICVNNICGNKKCENNLGTDSETCETCPIDCGTCPCVGDKSCDDNNKCTKDTCSKSGKCLHDNNVHCDYGKICEPATGNCVECYDNIFCKDTLRPICDSVSKKCAQCLDNSQCADKNLKVCDTRQSVNGIIVNPYKKCAYECNAIIKTNENDIICSNGKVCDLRESIGNKINSDYGKCTLDCVSNDLTLVKFGITCLSKSGLNKACDDNLKSKTYGKCIFECNGDDIKKNIICDDLSKGSCDNNPKSKTYGKCKSICSSDKDCIDNPFKPACDTDKKSITFGQCVECTKSSYCEKIKVSFPGWDKKICSTTIKQCVSCLNDKNCVDIYKTKGLMCIGDPLALCKGNDCKKYSKDPFGGFCAECVTNQDCDKKYPNQKRECSNFVCSTPNLCPTTDNPTNTKLCQGKEGYNCCKPEDQCGISESGEATCVSVPKCRNVMDKLCYPSNPKSTVSPICCNPAFDCGEENGNPTCNDPCEEKDGFLCGAKCCGKDKVCQLNPEKSTQEMFSCVDIDDKIECLNDQYYACTDGTAKCCLKGESCVSSTNYCCQPGSIYDKNLKKCISLILIEKCNNKAICKKCATSICLPNQICYDVNGITLGCINPDKTKFECKSPYKKCATSCCKSDEECVDVVNEDLELSTLWCKKITGSYDLPTPYTLA